MGIETASRVSLSYPPKLVIAGNSDSRMESHTTAMSG